MPTEYSKMKGTKCTVIVAEAFSERTQMEIQAGTSVNYCARTMISRAHGDVIRVLTAYQGLVVCHMAVCKLDFPLNLS